MKSQAARADGTGSFVVSARRAPGASAMRYGAPSSESVVNGVALTALMDQFCHLLGSREVAGRNRVVGRL